LYKVLANGEMWIYLPKSCFISAGEAVGKLLTLGGIGVWWIVDIVLLVTGQTTPKDGSSWEPYY